MAQQSPSAARFLRSHRRAVVTAVVLAVLAAFVLVVLPQILGLSNTLDRLKRGNKSWLAVAVGVEAISIAGYAVLFRAVFNCEGARIGWRESTQITLAGLVATKFFAAAGAGGLALTVWALRASGLSGRAIARRMAAFEVLLYAVFMASLVIVGGALAIGVLSGRAPLAMTTAPAAFGAAVIAGSLAMRRYPDQIEVRLERGPSTRGRRVLRRLATVPRTLRDGVETAMTLVAHPTPGLLGAVVYWAFDIAALWASFRAFGVTLAVPVVILSYFVGQLANTIPIPGGVGGVEGGMIGSFIAFGVNGADAVLGVLAYRAISYWLPMLPGALAYFRLRRTVAGWRAT